MQRIEVLIPGQECSWAGWCEALGDSESVVKPWSAKINKNERKKWYIIVWKVKSSGEASPQSKAQWLLVQHSCPDWKFISPRWLKQSFSLRHKGSSKDSYGCKCYTKSPSSFFFIGVYSKMNQLYIYTYIHIHTYTYIYLLYFRFFSHIAITEHWVEFPVPYSGSLLVTYFIFSNVYMSIPISQLITPLP